VPAAETQSAVRAAYEDLPRVFTRIPCGLGASAYLALPVTEAATGLDAALRATQAHRLHLAPLDLAQDLPPLEFGSGKVCRFTADELRELVDERRLKRAHQRQDFDADRFAEFHWLVVEEAVTLDREPEARAVPVLFMNLNKDLGEIEPHKGRFPLAFEAALFFLLLAP
jgi:hypothetical protein